MHIYIRTNFITVMYNDNSCTEALINVITSAKVLLNLPK